MDTNPRSFSGWSWWPNMLAGLLWPFLVTILRRVMPVVFAASVAFALLFTAAGLIYRASHPSPGWTFSKWLLGTIVGALVCGLLASLLPWS